MPAPKPGTVADWDTNLANLLAASAGQIAAGWANGQIPPSNWMNWWMNLVGQWTDYLRDFELIAHTWTAGQIFNAGITASLANGVTINASSGAAGGSQALKGTANIGCWGIGTGATAASVGIYGVTNGSGPGAGVWGDGSIGGSGPGLRGTGNGSFPPAHLDPQAVPGSPSDGDLWVDSGTNGLGWRQNSLTQGLAINATGDAALAPARAAPANLSYLGTWGAVSSYAKVWKDALGVVHLQGAIGPGASPQVTAFTLPSGFRPSTDIGNGTGAGLTANRNQSSKIDPVQLQIVAATGVVSVVVGSGSGSGALTAGDVISLNGVSFATNM